MDELEDLTIEINIKSIDYLVNVNTINADKFVLEIQNIETAEVWRGAFESSCKDLKFSFCLGKNTFWK
jgi:hypothetical protein